MEFYLIFWCRRSQNALYTAGRIDSCKTVNLINTLGWSREMLIVNGRSDVIRHVLTLRIFGATKKLRFWQNCEEVLNRLNSASWAELHKGHVQWSRVEVTCRGEVMCRGHASCPKWFAFINRRSSRVRTLQKSKRKYQLVVRLKANKCYQELLCCLSSYINLLNLLNFQGLCSRFLDPGRFQTSSPWSRPLTNSDLKGVLIFVLVFDKLFSQLSGQLVVIWPFLDELLALLRSDHFRISCSTSVAWSVDDSRFFAFVNYFAPWLPYIIVLDCL